MKSQGKVSNSKKVNRVLSKNKKTSLKPKVKNLSAIQELEIPVQTQKFDKIIYTLLNTLVACLLAILPFQTILVQFLINKSGLPQAIALWKEVLVVLIILIFSFDLVKKFFGRKFNLTSQNPVSQLKGVFWVLLFKINPKN